MAAASPAPLHLRRTGGYTAACLSNVLRVAIGCGCARCNTELQLQALGWSIHPAHAPNASASTVAGPAGASTGYQRCTVPVSAGVWVGAYWAAASPLAQPVLLACCYWVYRRLVGVLCALVSNPPMHA
jgi:hypothetical protein